MSIGHEHILPRFHPRISQLRILRITPPRRAGAIDQDKCVVHHRCSHTKLHRLYPARLGALQRHHEISINIFSVRRQRISRRHLRHQIGLAQLPTLHPLRRRRALRLAFDTSLLHPVGKSLNLLIAQPPLVEKFSKSLLRQPRRHKAAASHLGNLPRMLLHLIEIN